MSLDPDQEEEEDIPEDLSDDEDDNLSGDEHQRARQDAARVLAAQVGKTTTRTNDRREAIVWTVVTSTSEVVAAPDNTVVASGIQPPTSPESSTLAGLVGGLPTTTTGEVDIVSLWLRLYPGDMQQHLAEINAAGLRSDHRFKAITEFEWVRFWGMIIGARQFSEKGKELWSIVSHGLREAPDYERFMKAHRFETIRRHVRDCFSASASDAWAPFRPVIEGFNANRARVMHHNYDKTFD
jgi:hypothetical protein